MYEDEGLTGSSLGLRVRGDVILEPREGIEPKRVLVNK